MIDHVAIRFRKNFEPHGREFTKRLNGLGEGRPSLSKIAARIHTQFHNMSLKTIDESRWRASKLFGFDAPYSEQRRLFAERLPLRHCARRYRSAPAQ
jgi:hypothetical protein